jgi:beta-lactamase regulating signal transducer with metallopeptidase domain
MFFVTNSPLLKALGWALIHSLWQFAIFVLLYAVLITLFPRIKGAIRHTISLYLLLAGSLLFAATFCYQYYFFSEDISNTLFSIPVTDETTYYNWSLMRGWIDKYSSYLSLIYLAMVALLFCRLGSWFLRIKHPQHLPLQKPPVEWRLFIQRRAAEMGITKKISLQLSSLADNPQVIGFIKPVILLPLSCISYLSPLQIEAVLLHELAHIKRNDFFINILMAVSSVVFFFNPFARRLLTQLRDERENACDEWVLQYCYPAQEYATALLELEKNRRIYTSLQIAVGGNKKKQLLHRIQKILELPQSQQPNGFIWLNLAVITAFLFLLITPASKQNLVGLPQNFSPFVISYLPFNEPAQEGVKIYGIKKEASTDQQTVNKPFSPGSTLLKQLPDQYGNNRADIESKVNRIELSNEEQEENMNNTLLVNEVSSELIELAYTLPEHHPVAEAQLRAMNHLDQQPFLPSNSFTYYCLTDSSATQIEIKEYAEAILKAEVEAKKTALKARNKSVIKKELNNELGIIQQALEEKKQLFEGRKLQIEALQKAILEEQKLQNKKTGKKRIVYI